MLTEREEKLMAFADSVIQTAFEGGNLEGGDIQELGVKHGLLTKEIFALETHGEIDYAEDGDWIYMYSDILLKK